MSDRIPMTKVGYDKLKTEVDRFELEEMPDCLLYTSPSPRDVEESRMPSSA